MADHDEEDQEHDKVAADVHDAIATVLHRTKHEMLLNTVVIAVTADQQGEKTLSCFTSPDQRTWETLGLLKFVQLDHGAFLTERRIVDDD